MEQKEQKLSLMGENSAEMERLFFSSTNVERLFNLMERTDYLVLYRIQRMGQASVEQGRVYLADLSEVMHLPMPEISKTVQHLQDKNYIIWETDPDKQRTYVQLTANTQRLLDTQRTGLLHAYEEIRSQIGSDQLKQMVETMQKVAGIVHLSVGVPPEVIGDKQKEIMPGKIAGKEPD